MGSEAADHEAIQAMTRTRDPWPPALRRKVKRAFILAMQTLLQDVQDPRASVRKRAFRLIERHRTQLEKLV